jgi:hypothetical protein
MNKPPIKKKGILTISFAIIILVIGVTCYLKYHYETGYDMSIDDKKSYIEKFLKDKNYSKAKDLTMVYFQDSSTIENEVFGNINICEKNGFTTFSEAESFAEQKDKEKKEEAKQQEDNEIQTEYNKIVDEVNSVKISNMTSDQLVKYVNEYMDFLTKYNDKNYDLTVKNLSNLKYNYAYEHADRYFDLYKNMERYKLKIGMTKDEVIAFTDYVYPERINKTTTSGGTHEQYVFGGIYLYFDNGTLTSFQN